MQRTAPTLSDRELNRALLARQLLLTRRGSEVPVVIRHLAGMQAQAPRAPYLGLWSRLVDFRPELLSVLVQNREAVRMPLLRGTIHLVTAEDAVAIRPTIQPVLERLFASSPFARSLNGSDPRAVVESARGMLATPLSRAELGQRLAEMWPAVPPMALAYTVTLLMPVVQPPPAGLWDGRGLVRWTDAAVELGVESRPLSVDELLRRYLAAFGPASLRDFEAWSGLRGTQDALTMTDELRRFRTHAGRELLDLEDAPRPGADVDAPVRFLPEYDNLLLGHSDRSRVLPRGAIPPLPPGRGAATGTVLIDGFMGATWRLTRGGGRTGLTVEPSQPLSRRVQADVADEGARMLSFLAPGETAAAVSIGPR